MGAEPGRPNELSPITRIDTARVGDRRSHPDRARECVFVRSIGRLMSLHSRGCARTSTVPTPPGSPPRTARTPSCAVFSTCGRLRFPSDPQRYSPMEEQPRRASPPSLPSAALQLAAPPARQDRDFTATATEFRSSAEGRCTCSRGGRKAQWAPGATTGHVCVRDVFLWSGWLRSSDWRLCTVARFGSHGTGAVRLLNARLREILCRSDRVLRLGDPRDCCACDVRRRDGGADLIRPAERVRHADSVD